MMSNLPNPNDFMLGIQKARREFVNYDPFGQEKTFFGRVQIDPDDFYRCHSHLRDSLVAQIQHDLFTYERDLIYRSVVSSAAPWTSIRSTFVARDMGELLGRGIEYCVKVDAVAAQDKRIYIPVYDRAQMPRDVVKCSYCGGHTKNDKRGHCAGCGGPRNDSYLEDGYK